MKIHTIKFYFYGSDQLVPFDYKNNLISFLHTQILGKNNSYHNDTSLYTISPLYNSETKKNGLLFKRGAIWLIRTPSLEVFKDFYLKGKNSIGVELGWGLFLKTVSFEKPIDFKDKKELNIGATPIYLGQNPDKTSPDHITYKHDDELVEKTIKRILFTKANKLGILLKNDDINIKFDKTQPITTKAVKLGKAINVSSKGKLKISGTPEALALCYGCGVGKSTGCGFGFLYNIK